MVSVDLMPCILCRTGVHMDVKTRHPRLNVSRVDCRRSDQGSRFRCSARNQGSSKRLALVVCHRVQQMVPANFDLLRKESWGTTRVLLGAPDACRSNPQSGLSEC